MSSKRYTFIFVKRHLSSSFLFYYCLCVRVFCMHIGNYTYTFGYFDFCIQNFPCNSTNALETELLFSLVGWFSDFRIIDEEKNFMNLAVIDTPRTELVGANVTFNFKSLTFTSKSHIHTHTRTKTPRKKTVKEDQKKSRIIEWTGYDSNLVEWTEWNATGNCKVYFSI